MDLRHRVRHLVRYALLIGAVAGTATAAGAPAPTTAQGAPRLSEEDVGALVRAHNAQRREVGAPPLEWAPDLGKMAEARAERLAATCRLAHLPRPDDIGENLLLALPESSGGEAPATGWPTATQVVEAWAAERSHYSYQRNRCAPGRGCLHYTQIVWSATREIGCAVAICPAGGRVWVCDYRPAGNIPGQRPY